MSENPHVIDPTTGEFKEVLPTQYLQDGQPYSYQEARAAHMRVSVERRRAILAYEEACDNVGAAEKEYRRALAKEMLRQKTMHGATMAEPLAKGEDRIAQLKETLTIAEGKRTAAWQVILTTDGDRTGVTQLVKWSQAVEGWEHE